MCKFSRKAAIKFQKCFCVTLFQKFVTDYHWNNLGLSNYKRMKRNLEFGKNTCYNSKRNYLVLYSKESPLAPMHFWHLSTIRSFSEEYFAERLFKGVS